ncbi:MAG TPA: HAD family hydrolase, partial [Reyranella sp.]|nr:HAD family hydrolase [Reyranella sp.]
LSVRRGLERLGKADEALADRIADAFTEMRRNEYRLYPDAHATIDALRQTGVKLALVTNGAAETQRAKIVRFELGHRFDHIQIEGEFGQGKPELAVYRHALDKLGCEACDAWMVGDNYEWEVVAPQRLGMCGIWYDPFDTGVPAQATAQPTRIIKRLAELVE